MGDPLVGSRQGNAHSVFIHSNGTLHGKGRTNRSSTRLSQGYQEAPFLDPSNWPGDLSVSASRNGNFYELLIPGQQKTKDLKLDAGDFRAVIPLIPLSRPTITECIAEVSYPEYLALPNFESKSMDRSVTFPKGSTLTLRGKTNRPVSMMVASTETQAHDAKHEGNSFTVTMKNLQQAELAQLRFIDTHKLKPKLVHTIELIARADAPPFVDFSEIPPESSILLLETKNLAIQSKDDLGIDKTLLKLKAIRGNDLLIDTTLYNQAESNSSVTKSGFDFPFDPRLFTLQDGDVAEFTAFVSDRLPGREATPSRTVRFFIVGPERHAEIIRERMEAIMARTSEIAREQENLLMETIELEEAVEASEESIDAKTERKLSKLADMQRANSRNLKANAEEGMEILEDAVRNPLFDQEALKDFGKTLEQMKSVASNQMSPASSKMQQAQSSSPPSASESLEEAEELEREALSQLQEILSDSSEQLRKPSVPPAQVNRRKC
jgi:tetratricopeptide (TPR) repeat protein